MDSLSLSAAFGPFLDPVALAIVGGGTVVAVMLRTDMVDLRAAISALGMLGRPRFDAEPLLAQIGAFGRIAQRHGVNALDRSVIADPDVAAAVAAIVDGSNPDAVATLIEHRRRLRIERDVAAADVWASAAETAPAVGMIGTLIGLVKMFMVMNDPAQIGGAMAIALLSTLYGAIIASGVAMPVAARLRRIARAAAFERQRLTAPLVALAEREAPRRRDRTDKAAA